MLIVKVWSLLYKTFHEYICVDVQLLIFSGQFKLKGHKPENIFYN